jgi:hypothetical protein
MQVKHNHGATSKVSVIPIQAPGTQCQDVVLVQRAGGLFQCCALDSSCITKYNTHPQRMQLRRTARSKRTNTPSGGSKTNGTETLPEAVVLPTKMVQSRGLSWRQRDKKIVGAVSSSLTIQSKQYDYYRGSRLLLTERARHLDCGLFTPKR